MRGKIVNDPLFAGPGLSSSFPTVSSWPIVSLKLKSIRKKKIDLRKKSKEFYMNLH
jgi:hypothetical protein